MHADDVVFHTRGVSLVPLVLTALPFAGQSFDVPNCLAAAVAIAVLVTTKSNRNSYAL